MASLSEDEQNYLKSIYSDPKKVGSLGSIKSLYRVVKNQHQFDISLNQIKKWLKSQETYTLHKDISRKIKRNKVVVGDINQQWDMDIGDLSKFSTKNRQFKYILLSIDVLSKFIRTVPLKTKGAKEVTNAFNQMIREIKPETLHTDRGSEFTNKIFQNLLQEKNIKHFFTNNELKAMLAERAIKTIKLKIFKYFTESRKFNWIDVLPDITSTYNSTPHTVTGIPPKQVTEQNEDIIWKKIYPDNFYTEKNPVFKYQINDKVRISFLKKTFERAYDYFWTGEIFIITERFVKDFIPKYRLKDWNNEAIEGSFYTEELQEVFVDENTTYRIEKIISRRTRNGIREVQVKWFLWPKKFNSWIPANSIETYN